MNRNAHPRSLKRILIETVIFSFLLALLLMYNLREDKSITNSSETTSDLSVGTTNTIGLF